jgi:predicted  nucleic acid-binding Zn-ribbon protein
LNGTFDLARQLIAMQEAMETAQQEEARATAARDAVLAEVTSLRALKTELADALAPLQRQYADLISTVPKAQRDLEERLAKLRASETSLIRSIDALSSARYTAHLDLQEAIKAAQEEDAREQARQQLSVRRPEGVYAYER